MLYVNNHLVLSFTLQSALCTSNASPAMVTCTGQWPKTNAIKLAFWSGHWSVDSCLYGGKTCGTKPPPFMFLFWWGYHVIGFSLDVIPSLSEDGWLNWMVSLQNIPIQKLLCSAINLQHLSRDICWITTTNNLQLSLSGHNSHQWSTGCLVTFNLPSWNIGDLPYLSCMLQCYILWPWTLVQLMFWHCTDLYVYVRWPGHLHVRWPGQFWFHWIRNWNWPISTMIFFF